MTSIDTNQSTETAVVKVCVKCGTNLNGRKRMKDSKGLYWCPECGKADQEQKAARLNAETTTQSAVAINTSREPRKNSDSSRKVRLIGMIIALVILVAIALYMNLN